MKREGVEGVKVIRLGVARVRVVIEEGEAPRASAEVVRAWDEMAGRNPRLFNGPLLSVVSIDAATGLVGARFDTYQRLVVQPGVRTGVRQLSVTGLLERDGKYLMGRRGPQTRMYAGLWEVGPSGGVEPPAPGAREVGHEALVDELRREVREEAGLELRSGGEAAAIVYDPWAESYDVVLRGEAGEGASPATHEWEYQDMRWVGPDELRAWERERGEELIPPARAIIRELI